MNAKYLASMVRKKSLQNEVNKESQNHILVREKTMVFEGLIVN